MHQLMHQSPERAGANIAWRPAERFAFRAAFTYFALFFLASLFDVGPGPRRLLSAIHSPLVRWLGERVIGLRGDPNDAGVPWAVARQLVAVLAALAIAIVWSLVSRRTEYRRLHGWSRMALRYYVAVIMLVYGGFKVINTQFPPLSLEQLTQPLGAMSPMGLLWSFMGYSPAYTTFAGLGEVTGAFLLFFRRTTTLGALIVFAVMTNVALMNYAYDVPVKQLSTNLVLAAVVLVLPDARRLLDVLVLNASSRPADVSFVFPRWLAVVRRFLKPLIVVVATCVPLAFSWKLHSRLRDTPPLYGVYEVSEFVRNGVSVPPLITDATRWRSVLFSRPKTMSIRLMPDSVVPTSATIDTVTHRIAYRARSGSRRGGELAYELVPGGLHLRGVDQADSVDVTLRRVDPQRMFRLLGGVR